MVGVAGASKGCATCRRRKVKCDEARPKCRRCSNAHYDCEGYERWSVFIERTQAGYERRRPLQETKPTYAPTLKTINSPAAAATCYISWFYEFLSHAPPSKFDTLSSPLWLAHFIDKLPQESNFRRALLAVALVTWGKSVKSAVQIAESRRMYTSCLRTVRDIIRQPDVSIQDDVLATVCALILYEALDPTSRDKRGWLRHLSGLARLIECRGPLTHQNIGTRAILEHCRYLVMIQGLFRRKASFFSSPRWLEYSWKDAWKHTVQQLVDCGLRLAMLCDRYDLANQCSAAYTDCSTLVKDCVELYNHTAALYTDTTGEQVGMTGPALMSHRVLPENIDVLVSITWLGIRLGACISAIDALYLLKQQWPERIRTSDQSEHTRMEQASHLHYVSRSLAKQVVALAQLCPAEQIGCLGCARVAFSLRLASQQLTVVDHEAEVCRDLLDRFHNVIEQFSSLSGIMAPPES